MERLTEFNVNRALLNPDFESYRFDSRPIEIVEKKLQEEVTHAELSRDNYSLCHAQLHAKQNLLVVDDFNPGLAFYVSEGNLHRIDVSDSSATDAARCVYRLPWSPTASLSFVSSDLAVAVEPQGKIILLRTGQRSKAEKFVKVFDSDISTNDALLLTTRKAPTDSEEFVLHLLICSTERDEDGKVSESSGNFNACLRWIVLHRVDREIGKESWQIAESSSLYGKAVPRFAKFVPYKGSLRLVVCADCRFTRAPRATEHRPVVGPNRMTSPLYSYIQNETEATITFSLANDVVKNDVQIAIRSKKIQVIIRKETVLVGELYALIDSATSTWLIDDSKLEITIFKAHPARWPVLFEGDDRGEEVLDPEYLESVHDRLWHLTSTEQSSAVASSSLANSEALEECDEASDEFFMETFTLTPNGPPTKVCFSNLTGHQYLMDICSSDGLQLVLRHDVDGLVWNCQLDEHGFVQAEHIHTLNAFGYVAASKRDKVLSIGCIDSGFVAIVDSTNNIFIYEVPKASELKGKLQKHVLKQFVTRLPNAGRLLGGRVSNNKLLLLSSNTLFIITFAMCLS